MGKKKKPSTVIIADGLVVYIIEFRTAVCCCWGGGMGRVNIHNNKTIDKWRLPMMTLRLRKYKIQQEKMRSYRQRFLSTRAATAVIVI